MAIARRAAIWSSALLTTRRLRLRIPTALRPVSWWRRPATCSRARVRRRGRATFLAQTVRRPVALWWVLCWAPAGALSVAACGSGHHRGVRHADAERGRFLQLCARWRGGRRHRCVHLHDPGRGRLAVDDDAEYSGG